jgi:hypothetical protein
VCAHACVRMHACTCAFVYASVHVCGLCVCIHVYFTYILKFLVYLLYLNGKLQLYVHHYLHEHFSDVLMTATSARLALCCSP